MTLKISETMFAGQVEDLLSIYRWHWYHPRPARVLRGGKEIYETPYAGQKGFLDYLALRPPRILVVELKDETKEMSPEQSEWFRLWEECQRTIIVQPLKIKGNRVDMKLKETTTILTLPEIYLWRPSDYDQVKEILR